MSATRILTLAVDCHEGSVAACRWMVHNMCRDGDEVHILHVLPRSTENRIISPSDLASLNYSQDYESALHSSERFIAQRILPELSSLRMDPVIHMIKAQSDADSIGAVLCRKALDLGSVALVMNNHTKSKVTEFFVGSVCSYCTHHSAVPVVVHK